MHRSGSNGSGKSPSCIEMVLHKALAKWSTLISSNGMQLSIHLVNVPHASTSIQNSLYIYHTETCINATACFTSTYLKVYYNYYIPESTERCCPVIIHFLDVFLFKILKLSVLCLGRLDHIWVGFVDTLSILFHQPPHLHGSSRQHTSVGMNGLGIG